MTTTQCTKSSATTSIAIRFDPMSKTRMAWITAQFPDLKPSRTMILRRALQHYQQYIEAIQRTPDEDFGENMEMESLRLSRSGNGEVSPWKDDPDFAHRPEMNLTELIREFNTNRNRRDTERFFKSSPFKARAERMKGGK